MKKSLFSPSVQIVCLILIIFGCNDKTVEIPANSPGNNPVPVTPVPDERPFRVNAGIDQVIFSPLSGTKLEGHAFDQKYLSNLTYNWKKITGSIKCIIDDSASQQPNLSNLEKGIYEFALTATAPDGKSESDIVKIQVVEPAGEFVITNLSWSCPMECSLQMGVKVSSATALKIFAKSAMQSSGWVEVEKENTILSAFPLFMYGRSSDSIWMYTIDNPGLTDVKIVFQ